MARFKHIAAPDTPSSGDPDQRVEAAPDRAVVAPAAPRRRRGRSNSERGRAYRKRQEQAAAQLEAQVEALRAAVQDKQFLLGVWEAKYLRSRHSLESSRVAVVREYHALFRHGLRPGDARQEPYVYSIMDPEVDVGLSAVRGPETVLDQWRLHTSAFTRYSGELVGPPVVAGSLECPVVHVRIGVEAVVGEATVRGLFPPSAWAAARLLLRKCMDRTVRFSCTSSFQFTREGRVGLLLVQIGYADGFVAAGLELAEVAELLRLSALTPLSTITLGEATTPPATRPGAQLL